METLLQTTPLPRCPSERFGDLGRCLYVRKAKAKYRTISMLVYKVRVKVYSTRRKMATCLQAWCGTGFSANKPKIRLLSKLGGTFLGFAEPKQDHEDQEGFVRCLQSQGSKLMPHEFGLPSKYLQVELVDNKNNTSPKTTTTATLFWDEAHAKAEFVKQFGVTEDTHGVRFDIPGGCADLGSSANFFKHYSEVSLVGTHQKHYAALTCVFGFPVLTSLFLELLSVDLDSVPDSVPKLCLQRLWLRSTKLPFGLTHIIAVHCEARCADLIDRLCACKDLVLAEIIACKVEASIPKQLGSLRCLEDLSLCNCGLVGSIPSELGTSNLHKLRLPRNKLTGSIPTHLANLTNLTVLELSGNKLSGSIPTWFGTFKLLQRLELQNNQLTGQIPTELGQATSLESLLLHDNNLCGSVPTELGFLQHLKKLTTNKLLIIPSNFVRPDRDGFW